MYISLGVNLQPRICCEGGENLPSQGGIRVTSTSHRNYMVPLKVTIESQSTEKVQKEQQVRLEGH